jgi:hypothetical protein
LLEAPHIDDYFLAPKII